MHPCDDGEHNCDENGGGICYETSGGGGGQIKECVNNILDDKSIHRSAVDISVACTGGTVKTSGGYEFCYGGKGKTFQLFANTVDTKLREDVERMKKVCYSLISDLLLMSCKLQQGGQHFMGCRQARR